MNAGTATFIVGVLVGVVSFLIKELCADSVRAVRFRRRLAEDIKMLVENYKGHYPALQRLKDAVRKNRPAFIWDSALGNAGSVAEAAHYLEPLEASMCSRFYDELSRMNEIRAEYNFSVRGIVTDEQKRELNASIAVACLGDLQKHYLQVISRGCKCLLELNKNHSFLRIDESQCQEDLDRRALNNQSDEVPLLQGDNK